MDEQALLAVDNRDLGPDDSYDVKKAIFNVAANWKPVGAGLRIPAHTLATISASNSDPGSCLQAMVDEWLRNGQHPNWRKLVEIVAEPSAGNNMVVAVKIAAAHKAPQGGGGQPPQPPPPQPARPPPSSDRPPIFKQRPSVRNLSLLKYEEYGQRKKLSIVDSIAADPNGWQNLARDGLEMPGISNAIGMIAARNPTDTKKCTTELLDQWRRSGDNPTWNGLIEALEDANFMVLAGDVARILPIATNIRDD